MEEVDRLLAALGLVDDPALVLEGQLDGRTDALVVLDGQDACTHTPMMPHSRRERHTPAFSVGR